jgi:pyrroline-5-carboxylate reductase
MQNKYNTKQGGKMNNKKIAILGGGNIGMSIAQGLLMSKAFKKEDIFITRLAPQSLSDLAEMGIKASHNNEDALRDADYVIFSVQPRQASKVFTSVKPFLKPEKHTIISIVTAFNIDDIEKIIGTGFNIVRIMPNTAISICESMSCLASKDKEAPYFAEVKAIFDKLGVTLIIDEKLMAAATVLGSCGTAFFLRFIRAASQGGTQVGFHAEEAQLIAAQVAKGAAALLLKNGNHPEQEIDKVTTPLGVTIKGLNEMEHNGLSSAVIKGIVHSYNEIDKVK